MTAADHTPSPATDGLAAVSTTGAAPDPRTLLAVLVTQVERVGHRWNCRVQPCGCWWAHGLYDAVNAAADFLETQP